VVRAENFRPNGLVVAHTAVTMWTVPGGAAAVGRSHSGDQRAPFVLIRVPCGRDARNEPQGLAVRRGETFPELGPDWLRIAVRDPATSGAFARSLREVLT